MDDVFSFTKKIKLILKTEISQYSVCPPTPRMSGPWFSDLWHTHIDIGSTRTVCAWQVYDVVFCYIHIDNGKAQGQCFSDVCGYNTTWYHIQPANHMKNL